MRATVVDCASCGAPLGGAIPRLSTGALVPCLYCGALLRLPGADAPAGAAPTVERRLTPEIVARAREAALRGGRDEALAVCVREGGIDGAAAGAAVDDLVRAIGSRAVFTQPLSAMGWTIVLGSGALALGGVAVLAWPSPARLAGLAFLGFGALNLAVLARGIATSLRFLFAERGSALVVRSVRVGPTGFSDGAEVHSLAVDVTPARGGPPFHARLVLPVRPLSVGKVAAGQRLPVRFADGGAWIRSDT